MADRLRTQDDVDLHQPPVLQNAQLHRLASALGKPLERGASHRPDIELAERGAAERDERAPEAERPAGFVAGHQIVACHGREQAGNGALVQPQPPADLHDAEAARIPLQQLEDLDRLADRMDRTRAARHGESIVAVGRGRQTAVASRATGLPDY